MSKRSHSTRVSSTKYREYEPIKRNKYVSRQRLQSPLSPAIGTFQTVPSYKSVSSYNSFDITGFSQIEMAHTLKNMFMVVDKDSTFDKFFSLIDTKSDLIQKFDLAAYNFNKDLIYPATLINIMSRVNHLDISDYETMKDNPDIYSNYGSKRTKNYLFTIFDTIGIKVLYLISHNNKFYLSPLNIRNTRDILRKRTSAINTQLDDPNYIQKNNRDLRKKFGIKDINSVELDATTYDVVMITEAFHVFIMNPNNIQVSLHNFDKQEDHKSSMLTNNVIAGPKQGHIISVNKCYNYTIVNTTWKPLYTYSIDSFTPGVKKFYHIHKVQHTLNEVPVSLVQSANLEYYYSHFVSQANIYITLDNIHLYSSKHKSQIGGTFGTPINHERAIPEVSVCSDIYFPHNLHGFCWFSSLINALFYTDDISVIFLNKAIRHMEATLEYIKDFYDHGYKTFDISNLKEFTKHLIYLFTFIYTSFSILSKNQLQRIKNKRKWFEIYNKILTEYYQYIYVYIIVLSKTTHVEYK